MQLINQVSTAKMQTRKPAGIYSYFIEISAGIWAKAHAFDYCQLTVTNYCKNQQQ